MIRTKVKKEVFLLEGVYKNTKVLKSLKNKIKENTKNSKVGKTNVIAKTTSFVFLRKDPDFITFITDIRKDINKIYPYDFIIIDAWGNAYEKGQYANEHTHIEASACCGILYLSSSVKSTRMSPVLFTTKTMSVQAGTTMLFLYTFATSFTFLVFFVAHEGNAFCFSLCFS